MNDSSEVVKTIYHKYLVTIVDYSLICSNNFAKHLVREIDCTSVQQPPFYCLSHHCFCISFLPIFIVAFVNITDWDRKRRKRMWKMMWSVNLKILFKDWYLAGTSPAIYIGKNGLQIHILTYNFLHKLL